MGFIVSFKGFSFFSGEFYTLIYMIYNLCKKNLLTPDYPKIVFVDVMILREKIIFYRIGNQLL